jgi:agmatinase
VTLEDCLTGDLHYTDSITAELINLLRAPEDVEELAGDGIRIPKEVITELVEKKLVVDASNPAQALAGHLVYCQPTFLGCPEGLPQGGGVSVIGAPVDILSETGSGANAGAAAIRLASSSAPYHIDPNTGTSQGFFDYYRECLALQGVTFVDVGNIVRKTAELPEDFGRRLEATVHVSRTLGSFPLVLGGDHSISFWCVKALAGEPICILHLDAHSDLAPLPRQNLPSNSSVARAILDLSNVASFLTVGIRGFLPVKQPELKIGHRLVSLSEARRLGLDNLGDLLPEDLPCFVSLDLDVLELSLATATNTPEPGGFSFDEMRSILDSVGRKRRVVGCDIVELNASRDPHLITARAAVRLILTLLEACFKQL